MYPNKFSPSLKSYCWDKLQLVNLNQTLVNSASEKSECNDNELSVKLTIYEYIHNNAPYYLLTELLMYWLYLFTVLTNGTQLL